MAICFLPISLLGNAYGLCHIPFCPSGFVLVGSNFEFKYIQFQIAFAGLFFVSLNPVVDLADLTDFFVDFFINFLSL